MITSLNIASSLSPEPGSFAEYLILTDEPASLAVSTSISCLSSQLNSTIMEQLNSTKIIKASSLEHADIIVTLVKELNVFEQLSVDLCVSSDALHKSLVNGNCVCYIAFAMDDNDTECSAGYALAYQSFCPRNLLKIIEMGDLYVRDKFRRKGIGFNLFIRIVKLAAEFSMSAIKWDTLLWNTEAQKFYSSMGAEEVKEAVECGIDRDALLPLIQKKYKPVPNCAIENASKEPYRRMLIAHITSSRQSADGMDDFNKSLETLIDDPRTSCFIVLRKTKSKEVIGWALLCEGYSTMDGLILQILDLQILPKFRRKKQGANLMQHLAQHTLDTNHDGLSWNIDSANDAAIAFARWLDAVAEDEADYKLREFTLAQSAFPELLP